MSAYVRNQHVRLTICRLSPTVESHFRTPKLARDLDLITFHDLGKVRYDVDGTPVALPINTSESAAMSRMSYDEIFDDVASDTDLVFDGINYQINLLKERFTRETREAREAEAWRLENMTEGEYWEERELEEYEQYLLDEDGGRSRQEAMGYFGWEGFDNYREGWPPEIS